MTGLIALMCFALGRAIVHPIRNLVEISRGYAAGNLCYKALNNRQDETGLLMDTIGAMRDQLANVIGDIKRHTKVVNSKARGIVDVNHRLLVRIENEVGSLSETSGTVTGLSQSVERFARAAENASNLAESARSNAQAGVHVSKSAADAMKAISDSSREIGEITGLIDEIAFQTNLLALNAAIEAARAGEQGRGFAVVAGEVRVLAQRASEAASRIKNLIDESLVRVGHGADLVRQSGTALGTIVESVTEVERINSNMAHGSQEHAVQITELTSTIEQILLDIREDAQLITEASNSGKDMGWRADSLEELVDFFQTEEDSAVIAS